MGHYTLNDVGQAFSEASFDQGWAHHRNRQVRDIEFHENGRRMTGNVLGKHGLLYKQSVEFLQAGGHGGGKNPRVAGSQAGADGGRRENQCHGAAVHGGCGRVVRAAVLMRRVFSGYGGQGDSRRAGVPNPAPSAPGGMTPPFRANLPSKADRPSDGRRDSGSRPRRSG